VLVCLIDRTISYQHEFYQAKGKKGEKSIPIGSIILEQARHLWMPEAP